MLERWDRDTGELLALDEALDRLGEKDEELRRLVAETATGEEIQAAAIRAGMVELRRGALLKVAQGVTSTEEILRDVPAEYLGLED